MLILLGGVLESAGLALLLPLLALLSARRGGGMSAPSQAFAWAGARKDTHGLLLVLGLFVLIVALRAIVLSRRDRLLALIQTDLVLHFRVGLIRAFGSTEWAAVAQIRYARITDALASDVPRVGAAAQLLLQSIVALVTLVTLLLLALLLAPALGILATLLLALGAVALVPALHRSARYGRRRSESSLAVTDQVSQLIGGLKLAVAQNMQGAFVDQVAATSREMAKQQLVVQRLQSRTAITVSTAAALTGALVVLAGVGLAVPPVRLIALLTILLRITGPAQTLQRNAQQIAELLPAYAVLRELGDELPVSTPVAAPPALIGHGAITLERVGYRYPGTEHDVFSEVNERFEPGVIVGLAGRSGAGKTTLVELIASLIAPSSGEIRVDGALLGPEHLNAWRARLAYVAQDSYLFNDTIRRNLAWGCKDLDDDAMWHMLRLVEMEAQVRGLPAGLDNLALERGTRLSGGERQRLAIARALLRRPQLLILDEATNAIDPDTEARLLNRIAALADRPTIIIVAHRTETLRQCERTIVLEPPPS